MLFFKKSLFVFVISLMGRLSLQAQKYNAASASLGIVGDTADVKTTTSGGTALVGGGGSVNAAFKWMIQKSGGGDVVVITASGSAGYNEDIYNMGGVNSVQTLNIISREQADNDTVANIIRNAEMLFIGGGDQSNYMKYLARHQNAGCD